MKKECLLLLLINILIIYIYTYIYTYTNLCVVDFIENVGRHT